MKSSSTAIGCWVLFPAALARLRTRNGKDWTESFPSLAKSMENLKAKDAVAGHGGGHPRCRRQKQFSGPAGSARRRGNAEKIVAYVFDLLHLDGKDLTALPLTERKEKLEDLLKKSKQSAALRYSEHIVGQGGEMFAKACETGLEGIISKQADAPYVAGRQKGWLKIKCAQRQEFIILGFSDARTGGRALWERSISATGRTARCVMPARSARVSR